MKIKLITSILLASILITGCKKQEAKEIPFVVKELLKINGNLLSSSYPTFVFLSNKEGKTLSCEEHIGLNTTILSNDIPMEEDYFDLSIVNAINSDQNLLRIETYPDVQRSEWLFKKQGGDTIMSSAGTVTFLADDLVDNIEYALIDGFNGSMTSLSDLKTTGVYTTLYDLNKDYIFFRFRMAGEEQYRYVEFNNLTDGDTIQLDLASYPLGALENIQSNGADLIKMRNVTGLRIANSFEQSNGLYRDNITIQDYVLPDGQVWYPDGIFDSFFVRIEMKKDSFEYLLENMGTPIYEYNPTPPELDLEGDKSRFRVNSSATDADFVSATWAVEKPEGSIEWIVFHKSDATDFFRLPEFPTCLLFDQSWFAPEDFRLKSMASYNYQNFEDYKGYLDSRYGAEAGGEGSRLILAGGNYEKKTILK